MTEQASEQAIVDGLRRGDRGAWDALCRQYGNRVCRYVACLVGNNEDAIAEVFQETMLAVAKSGRALGGDARLWAWVSRISHNQAALYWRRHYRQQPTVASGEAVEVLAGDDPVDQLTRAETATEVRSVLAEMDAEWVALLAAKYLDGMTVGQVAEAFGGTESSIRNKLARGGETTFANAFDAGKITRSWRRKNPCLERMGSDAFRERPRTP